MTPGLPPIAVGTDGSTEAAAAVTWSAQRAVRLGRVLLLAAADPPPVVAAGGVAIVPYVPASHDVETKRARLDAIRADLVASYPELTVHIALLDGPPAPALLAVAAEAELLAIGTRRLGGLTGILLGSVGDQVLTETIHPVAMVPVEWAGGEIHPDRPDGPVVLALDLTEASRNAARFAFEEAAGRGVGVLVVSALDYPEEWSDRHLLDDERVAGQREEAGRKLEEFLAAERRTHPEVPVDYQIAASSPSAAVAEASLGAGLVVVGSRRRGTLAGLILGSTSRRVAQVVRCPVIVVPHLTADPD